MHAKGTSAISLRPPDASNGTAFYLFEVFLMFYRGKEITVISGLP